LVHSATIPTLGDAVEALGHLCGDVSETLKNISDLSAELASKDRVGVENVNEARPTNKVVTTSLIYPYRSLLRWTSNFSMTSILATSNPLFARNLKASLTQRRMARKYY
jgi:hypothetical protein